MDDRPDDQSVDQRFNQSANFPDAIVEAYEDIEDGDASTTLTLRDEDLAAFLFALERTDDLETIIKQATEWLEQDEVGNISRANAMSLLMRIGLHELDASLVEDVREGKREFLVDQASEI